ncbi:MAG: hypothetical protein CNLJKLNK_00524 [Holosporales bacterium]
MKKSFIILAACFTLISCSSKKKIQDVNHTLTQFDTIKSEKIEQSIIKAGSHRRWVCSARGKGIVRCEQNARSHSATVDVFYTNDNFSIKHVKTEGLKEKNGKVHKKYNKWIEKLKESIITELNVLKTESK